MQSQALQLLESDFVQIDSSSICSILSYSLSPSCDKTLVCTHFGIVLVDNYSQKYCRYEDDKQVDKQGKIIKHSSPFWNSKSVKGTDENYGVQIGSIIDSRAEIALIPEQQSRYWSPTYVYIYDYKLGTILYCNNFFLAINQLQLLDEYIITSSRRRIVLYNFLDDFTQKNEKYYLEMYKNTSQNNQLRYLALHCEEQYLEQPSCKCGQFVTTKTKPFKMLFIKQFTINKDKFKALMIYDENVDKEYSFQTIIHEDLFGFTISPNGKYLCYSENYGRSVKVYDIQKNSVHCVLWLGRTMSRIISLGFFQLKDENWIAFIREKQNSTATMHMFKLMAKSPVEMIQSQYKRYFSLLEKTFKDYNISKQLIGPDFYLQDGILYCFSLCGVVYNVIDFKKTGNHEKKKLQNFGKWVQKYL